MAKKIALIGFIALMLVVGMNLTVNAESDESTDALKEKAMKAEKKAMELEVKLANAASKAKSVDDLDDAPSIDAPHKGGPSIVVGPKGKVSVWMTLTVAAPAPGNGVTPAAN